MGLPSTALVAVLPMVTHSISTDHVFRTIRWLKLGHHKRSCILQFLITILLNLNLKVFVFPVDRSLRCSLVQLWLPTVVFLLSVDVVRIQRMFNLHYGLQYSLTIVEMKHLLSSLQDHIFKFKVFGVNIDLEVDGTNICLAVHHSSSWKSKY